jgi:heat shock protein HslJ
VAESRHGERPALTARRALKLAAGVFCVCLFPACVKPSGTPAVSLLAGTRWQLLAIQSMDDAQGTTRIADPARFTLHLGADGRASLRLDCNRGTASFEATPAAEGASGSMRFGPVAATRALCPPPHLDERLVRDLGHVRSYLLKDGKLFLSLMADGGIYEWLPAASKENAR